MAKLVFISHEPLTQYLYHLFYMDEIYKAGFEISYWDCSEIVWKGLSLPDSLTESFIRKIKSLDEFSLYINQEDIRNTIFSVELDKDTKSLLLYKILSQKNCCTVRFRLFENCVLPTTLEDIFRSIKSGKILIDVKNRITNILRNRKLNRLYSDNGIKHYDVIFSPTQSGTVYINHPDYDNCLTKEIPKIIPEINYAVYLDNYFPYHPDIIKNNPNIIIDTKVHYDELNALFCEIETKFNLKVIIAAHPKADYKDNEFQGRVIVKYKTQELVRNASLVLLHSSNAIAFAITYEKPFMFISTSQYKLAVKEYNRMKRLSSYFKAPIIKLPQANRLLKRWERVPQTLCDKYKYTFLTKPEIENVHNVNIIIPCLSKLVKMI